MYMFSNNTHIKITYTRGKICNTGSPIQISKMLIKMLKLMSAL